MIVLTHLLFELLDLPLEKSVFGSGSKPPNFLACAADPWLLRLSLSSRSHAVRLTANALLSSASLWAFPLHPHPSVVGFCCGTSASAACRVAVANAVSLTSKLISLEGRARRRAVIAVATTSRSCGSVVNLRRLRGVFVSLLTGRLQANRPSSLTWATTALWSEMGRNDDWICVCSLKYVPTVPVVGVGKEGRTLVGPWGFLNRKLSFIELP